MAESGKIKASDIAEKDLFKNITKSADEFSTSLKGLEKNLKDIKKSFTVVLQTQEKVLKQNVKDSADIKAKTSALTKSQAARIGLIQVEKQELQLRVEQEKLNRQLAASQKQINKDIADSTKANQREADAKKKLNSAYSEGTARLNEMRKRYKDLAVQEKQNTTTGKLLRDEINKLDKQLKEVDASVGQFQRSVGDYKNQMKEAISETLAFGGSLGTIVSAFNKIYEAELLATAGANKFSATLKATGIGLIIAAALLIKALTDLNQSIIDTGTLAKATALDIVTFGDANEKSAKLTIAFRDTLIQLQKELQATTLDAEDFNEISEDTTIGFQTRNKALEESIRLGNESAKTQEKIAQGFFDIADAELKAAKQNALGGKPLAEAVQKQADAELKLLEAKDKVADKLRTDDEERRKRNLEQAEFEIDLILKKKQSAKADKLILEQRIADEKNQLEVRRKAANDLLAVNKKTTEEEIKIFKDKLGVQFDFNDLIATNDAVLLQRKLEGIKQTFINEKGLQEQTTLGISQTVLLAKIVKQAQENKIDNAETLKKLAEEEIANLKRIVALELETQNITLQEKLRLAEEDKQASEESIGKFNDNILTGEKVFNRKMLKAREELVAGEEELIDEVVRIKEAELLNTFILEKDAIKERKLQKEVELKEIAKLEEKYRVDTKAIEDAAQEEKDKKRQQELEEQKKIEVRRYELIVEETQKLTSALSDEIDKQSQKKLDAFDKEIDAREENVDRQTQLAEDGLTNQLAFEIAQKEKAELEKQEFEERVAKEKEALALVESYQAFLLTRLKEANANPNTAPFLALKDTLLAKGVSKSVVQFAAEGNNMIEGDGTTTSDSIPFMLSKKEAVIKASENIKHNDAVVSLNNGTFDKQYISITDMPTNVKVTDNTFASNQFITKLNEIKAEIKNKPVQTWEVNNINELVEKRIVADITQKIVYKHKYKFH